MKRKQLSLFAVLLLLFVLFAGCRQETVSESTPTPVQDSKATTTPQGIGSWRKRWKYRSSSCR